MGVSPVGGGPAICGSSRADSAVIGTGGGGTGGTGEIGAIGAGGAGRADRAAGGAGGATGTCRGIIGTTEEGRRSGRAGGFLLLAGVVVTGPVWTGLDVADLVLAGFVSAGPVLTGVLVAGPVFAGSDLAGRVFAGRVFAGRVPAGSVSAGVDLAGVDLAGSVSVGDVLVGVALSGSVSAGGGTLLGSSFLIVLTGRLATGGVAERVGDDARGGGWDSGRGVAAGVLGVGAVVLRSGSRGGAAEVTTDSATALAASVTVTIVGGGDPRAVSRTSALSGTSPNSHIKRVRWAAATWQWAGWALHLAAGLSVALNRVPRAVPPIVRTVTS
jgi:hypothetical protein